MAFEELLDQAIAMLQRRGRVTYGALKRQSMGEAQRLAALATPDQERVPRAYTPPYLAAKILTARRDLAHPW